MDGEKEASVEDGRPVDADLCTAEHAVEGEGGCATAPTSHLAVISGLKQSFTASVNVDMRDAVNKRSGMRIL